MTSPYNNSNTSTRSILGATTHPGPLRGMVRTDTSLEPLGQGQQSPNDHTEPTLFADFSGGTYA
jgi:hypothetical protein